MDVEWLEIIISLHARDCVLSITSAVFPIQDMHSELSNEYMRKFYSLITMGRVTRTLLILFYSYLIQQRCRPILCSSLIIAPPWDLIIRACSSVSKACQYGRTHIFHSNGQSCNHLWVCEQAEVHWGPTRTHTHLPTSL